MTDVSPRKLKNIERAVIASRRRRVRPAVLQPWPKYEPWLCNAEQKAKLAQWQEERGW